LADFGYDPVVGRLLESDMPLGVFTLMRHAGLSEWVFKLGFLGF